MAYNAGGSVFGGYAGGYNQTPVGIAPVFDPNVIGSGVVHTLGSDLPSVNPNTYPGTVHFGPSTTVVGHGVGQVLPSGTVVLDPTLNANAGVNLNAGY